MNYLKKRKRQNGRQRRNCEPTYHIWIDEYAQIHATIDKEIKDGRLPEVSFKPPNDANI